MESRATIRFEGAQVGTSWTLPYAQACIYLLWFSAAFDPIGTLFGIRYLALASVLILLVGQYAVSPTVVRLDTRFAFVFAIFVVFVPSYGMAIGLCRGGLSGDFIDTSYFAAAAYFSCSLVYLKGNLLTVGLKAQVHVLRLLCVAIFCCLLVPLFDGSVDAIYFFVERGIMFYGGREYAGVTLPYIYFIASPMLVFLLVREAWELSAKFSLRGVLLLALPTVALFLSGTRANIAISIAGVAFSIIWQRAGMASALSAVIAAPAFLLLLGLGDFDIAAEMLSSNEGSNSMKLSYLSAYADIFSDPITNAFGQGFNGHVWSSSLAGMVAEGASKTELTYFEILRVFGFPVGTTLLLVLLYFCFSGRARKSQYPWLAPASFMYLIVSFLNPYLFSSNGMLLLGFAAAAMSRPGIAHTR